MGNGLAYGAAAGPLHPAADRPLSRPPGQIPRPAAARVKDATRSLRTGLSAVLDPTATPVGRSHRPPSAGGGRPPGRNRTGEVGRWLPVL